jgi:hypothetical protein
VGDQLVRRAETLVWPTLKTHPARIVLSAMARHAMDRDEQPAYFGGWQALAIPLGYTDHDETARRAVGRAIEELRRAGYIRQDRKTSRSWKRRWYLELPS